MVWLRVAPSTLHNFGSSIHRCSMAPQSMTCFFCSFSPSRPLPWFWLLTLVNLMWMPLGLAPQPFCQKRSWNPAKHLRGREASMSLCVLLSGHTYPSLSDDPRYLATSWSLYLPVISHPCDSVTFQTSIKSLLIVKTYFSPRLKSLHSGTRPNQFFHLSFPQPWGVDSVL